MKCYFITNEVRENMKSISNGDLYIYETECPDDKVAEGESLVQNWELIRTADWRCVAGSDNEIDAEKSDKTTIPVGFGELVYNEGKFTGVYVEEINHILYFEDMRSARILTFDDEVGGWGHVKEWLQFDLSEKSKDISD